MTIVDFRGVRTNATIRAVTDIFSTYKLLFQYNNEIMLTSIDLFVVVIASFE